MSVVPNYRGTSGSLAPAGPIATSETYYPGVADATTKPYLAAFDSYIGVIRPHGYSATSIATPTPGLAWYTVDYTVANPTLTGLYGDIALSHSTAAAADTVVTVHSVVRIDGSRSLLSGALVDRTNSAAAEYFAIILQVAIDGSITAGAPVLLTDFAVSGSYYSTSAFPGTEDAVGVKPNVWSGGTAQNFPTLNGGALPVRVSDTSAVVGLSVTKYMSDVAVSQTAYLYARRLNISGTTITLPSSTWTLVSSTAGNAAAVPYVIPVTGTNITISKATFVTLSGPTPEVRAVTVDSATMAVGTWYSVWAPGVSSLASPGSYAWVSAVRIEDGRIGISLVDSAKTFWKAWSYTELGTSVMTTLSAPYEYGPGVTSRGLRTPNGGLVVSGQDGGAGIIAELRWDDAGTASLVGPTSVEYGLWDGEAVGTVVGNIFIGLSQSWAFGSSFAVSGGSSITTFTFEPEFIPLPDATVVLTEEPKSTIGSFFKLLGDFTIAHINGTQDIETADVKLVLNDYDDDGTLWIVSDVIGWWTTPEPDVPDNERGWSDGSYLDTGRYKARVFTVTGSYQPAVNNGYYIQRARDRLLRAVATARRTGVVFIAKESDSTAPPPYGDDNYTTIAKYATVVPSGQPLIATSTISGKTDWAVSFRAPDPVKYSVEPAPVELFEAEPIPYTTFASTYPLYSDSIASGLTYSQVQGSFDSVNVNNIGNYRTPVTITITGPVDVVPLAITNTTTNQTITLTQTLLAGEVLEINTATRRVALDGEIDYRYYLAPDIDWIYVAPGVNTFQSDASSNPSSSISLTFRHGWIG
jgi:DNA-binding transcriptional regulator YdaS (Cro superfamily)